MLLQVVILMYFQVVISMYFQVVLSGSNNVKASLSHVSTMYLQVHVLTRSYTFNGNDVGAFHKNRLEKHITYQ